MKVKNSVTGKGKPEYREQSNGKGRETNLRFCTGYMSHTIVVRNGMGQRKEGALRVPRICLVPKGDSMQRKVAYVFLYKNGIRERSVGIVRRYSTAEQPEVALELFGEEVRNKRWRIYYFTKGEALKEATYLWGSTEERGRSEMRRVLCRLCAEAGEGSGIVLLPEELRDKGLQGNIAEPAGGATSGESGLSERIGDEEWKEYLCARYDGKEITEEELREAFCRRPEPEMGENLRLASAKRLMEEIAKAAGGAPAEKAEVPVEETDVPAEKAEVPAGRRRRQRPHLDKLLLSKPPYVPCRRYEVEYSVRVTPEELSELPAEGSFGENSFVLHGYYAYHHILLGRRNGKEKDDYVLMIPGDYSEKQAGLAAQFGFPEFLPVIKKPETGIAASGTGLFGYYCGKI